MKKKAIILFVLSHLFTYADDIPIIIPLGFDCHVATELRLHKLRSQAFPFDWNITSFNAVYKAIQEDFAHFLNENYLIMHSDEYGIINTYYGIDFRHDFPNRNPSVSPEKQIDFIDPSDMPHYKICKNFLDFIEPVREKYNRRIRRFYDAVSGNSKVIFIRNNDITKEQSIKLYNLLRTKFPNLDFVLVVCSESKEMNRDWEFPGIKNFYARYIFEDWTKIFRTLGLLSKN